MRMRIDITPELQRLLYHELAVQDPRPTPARYVNDALEVALERDKTNREAADVPADLPPADDLPPLPADEFPPGYAEPEKKATP